MLILLSALALASDPAVTVRAPADRQVIQRTERSTTDVPVEVVAPSRIGRLVASARPTAGGPELAHVELAKQAGNDATSSFTASLALPAGGWYRLAVSVDGIAGPVELASVERFGVGEVFVVAGQSNSANSGEVVTPSRDDRVSAFDGAGWTLAADPMPGVQDTSFGGSPWPTCGKLLVDAWDVPVAFASCGYGGTSISQWQKGAEPMRGCKRSLFDGLVQRAQALGRFRAILWHQGESDAAGGTPAADYAAGFRALRDEVTKALGSSPPWVLANASFGPGFDAARMEAIRGAQQSLWREKVALQGPDTDVLLGDMRHSVDRIHFSEKGLAAHARLWTERLVALFPKR